VRVKRHEVGRRGERIASVFLTERGYRIVQRNWRIRGGEIDIVAVDSRTADLVFIEVKSRMTHSFGPPELSIGPVQKRAIRRAIETYVAEKEIVGPYRFDVLTVVRGAIRHIRNASLE